MGLKTFHLIFIVAAIILSLLFGYWAWKQYQMSQVIGYLVTFFASIIVAVGLIIYEIKINKHIKS